MKPIGTFRSMAWLLALFTSAVTCNAVDYHVATAQQLQNALTLAAASTVSNNIYLTNGYYTGNFNFNSTNVNELTLLAEPGVANSQISIDGGGLTRAMNISGTSSPNIAVQGITFIRNCGNSDYGSLRIVGGNTDILVSGCQFLSPSNTYGGGLEIDAGENATVANCTAAGAVNAGSGNGISIDVSSNVLVENSTFATNDGSGLAISATSIMVAASTFTGNDGTGADCSGTSVTVSGNAFTGNRGGGASCGGTMVTLSNNTFTGNSGTFLGGGGGGADCSGGTVLVTGNTFNGNAAFGVPQYSGGGGGGCYCSGPSQTLSNKSMF